MPLGLRLGVLKNEPNDPEEVSYVTGVDIVVDGGMKAGERCSALSSPARSDSAISL